MPFFIRHLPFIFHTNKDNIYIILINYQVSNMLKKSP